MLLAITLPPAGEGVPRTEPPLGAVAARGATHAMPAQEDRLVVGVAFGVFRRERHAFMAFSEALPPQTGPLIPRHEARQNALIEFRDAYDLRTRYVLAQFPRP